MAPSSRIVATCPALAQGGVLGLVLTGIWRAPNGVHNLPAPCFTSLHLTATRPCSWLSPRALTCTFGALLYPHKIRTHATALTLPFLEYPSQGNLLFKPLPPLASEQQDVVA